MESKDKRWDANPSMFIGQDCETSRNGQATRSLFGSWARTRHASVPDEIHSQLPSSSGMRQPNLLHVNTKISEQNGQP